MAKIKSETLETLDAEFADLNHFLRNASETDIDPAEVFERIANVLNAVRQIASETIPAADRMNWDAYDSATLAKTVSDATNRANDLFVEPDDEAEDPDPGEDPGGYDESTNPSNGWRAPEPEPGPPTAKCDACEEIVLEGTMTTVEFTTPFEKTGLRTLRVCEDCETLDADKNDDAL